jgi:hypothetical protein
MTIKSQSCLERPAVPRGWFQALSKPGSDEVGGRPEGMESESTSVFTSLAR